jgi:hypothetical protein
MFFSMISDTRSTGNPSKDSELERALLMLWGASRWDGDLVAKVLRSGCFKKSQLFPEAMARLLDGTHPEGLRLLLRGQGNSPTVEEASIKYDRLRAVGAYVEDRLSAGENWEAAMLDAAEQFGISEATVARDHRLHRLVLED